MPETITKDACFKMVYDLIHDENSQCSNLAMLIDMAFPGDDEDDVAIILRQAIKPYLVARASLGKVTMELMYQLAEMRQKKKEG